MPRLLVGLCAGSALVALACNDELVETVPKDVCYSEMRWIGGKRGSPEMYPGEDCVGCHIDNDGPPLALGGTLYPYVLGYTDMLAAGQSGEHCFGVEGFTITIEDGEGQLFEVVTNRAGNFYVEGDPDDFAKPFSVQIRDWQLNPDGTYVTTPMFTQPSYGGCAGCHSPDVVVPDPPLPLDDPNFRTSIARIGLRGYKPNGLDGPTVEDEIEALAVENGYVMP